jgi:uncharacterized RDD family membrane protein YckC
MHYFNRITLRTPESVELEFTLAGIGNRALALVIDYLIVSGLVTVISLVWLLVSVGALDWITNLGWDDDTLRAWLLALQILLTFCLYVGYFVVFETLWQGQTPGKRYTHIRVLQDNGRMVGLQQSVLRAVIRPIDDLFFVGAILIALSKQEKRLGDWAAGTVVIQLEKSEGHTFQISTAAHQLSSQLPEIAKLSQLRPDDFAVIREFLQRRTVLTPQARQSLALSLSQQVRSRLQILPDQLPSISPELLLEAAYLGYQNQVSLGKGSG